MKYIIGIIIGSFLALSVSVYAETKNTLEVVETLKNNRYDTIEKIFDHNNGVTCYTFRQNNGKFGGISCVKN